MSKRGATNSRATRGVRRRAGASTLALEQQRRRHAMSSTATATTDRFARGARRMEHRRGALVRRAQPRARGRRCVLLLRSHDRRVLPAVVRRALAAAPRTCASTPTTGRSRSGRVSRLQALPARRARSRRAPRCRRRARVPVDRGSAMKLPRVATLAAASVDVALPFPARLQGGHRAHAAGVRARAARRAPARAAA